MISICFVRYLPDAWHVVRTGHLFALVVYYLACKVRTSFAFYVRTLAQKDDFSITREGDSRFFVIAVCNCNESAGLDVERHGLLGLRCCLSCDRT